AVAYLMQRADESDFHNSVCPAKTAKDKRCLCAVLGLVWWMYSAFVYRTKNECRLNIEYNV
ncbi:hypothetical protein, partial [Leyella stercorea]|uniref:hypothetical protein n=1 Tax=Leyella stercorea TaxID=363265 RepID=UPI003FEF7F00